MMVLITYDVNTETALGKKRLRKVAKHCKNYGQRVQNSVFECIIDATRFKQVQNDLSKIIDSEKDSLRFYLIGNEYRKQVVHIGAKPSLDIEGPLLV